MNGADTYDGGDNVNNRETTFKIISTKLYVPRSVCWNEYKSKIGTKEADVNNLKRFPLDASFQGVNRLFVLAFDNTNNNTNRVERDTHRKYFLLRVNIRNLHDRPINDQIKKYDEI